MSYRKNDRGNVATGVLVTVGVIALIVALTLGGWAAGWWFKTQNTNRQRQLDQNNYGTQLGYVQKIDNEIVEVRNIDVQLTQVSNSEKPGLSAQRQAIVNQICTTETLLTSVPTNIAAFASTECS